jgi:hypothetical protein
VSGSTARPLSMFVSKLRGSIERPSPCLLRGHWAKERHWLKSRSERRLKEGPRHVMRSPFLMFSVLGFLETFRYGIGTGQNDPERPEPVSVVASHYEVQRQGPVIHEFSKKTV